MEVSHKIHLSSRKIRRELLRTNSSLTGTMTLTEIMTMIEMVAEESRIVTGVEIANKIREAKTMAEEETAEESITKGNYQEKTQVRIQKDREIVLDQIDMAVEVEMDNGYQEADPAPEVDHTLTGLEAGNLGMRKSKEVGLALKIDKARSGVDPDLITVVEII